MSVSARLFGYLEGSWRFERVIKGSQSATGMGIATWIRSLKKPDTLHYFEKGRLIELSTDFTREYIYRLQDGQLRVDFCQEGCSTDFFHIILLKVETPYIRGNGEHLCLADHYDLQYTFSTDFMSNCFSIFCKVHDPKKDYTIETIFYRQ